ncbi:hypothetical protein PHYPSEUDO_011764 [Phytophthora pseudosyringae]|uniref:Uncharacterized protein n=1 Tax=Phytophthora pseudosyringae TaxID=221518 RepID=A0A8T1V7T7_9STRA|nr:hypothetical protein PHYPSEUDO_011764 [Phytophthora pseudosyringae]
MAVLPVDAEESPRLAELRKLKSRAQSGERHRQLGREAANKVERKEPNSASKHEPKETEKSKPKRKKRNFFKWLFTPSVSTTRQVAPPPPPRVRVKIPIVYRNGEHKGVIVGGLQVPFSRPMQANRRSLMLSQDGVSCAIPEHIEIVGEFPVRLAWGEFEAEDKRKQEEKKRLKEEKLARELAK